MTSDASEAWTRDSWIASPARVTWRGRVPAASGSNIAMVDATASGSERQASRVLRSLDGGRTWSVIDTPLATGTATGIFSIAFRDRDHGIVVGGNYQKEKDAIDNAAGHRRRGQHVDAREGARRISIGGRLAAWARERSHRRRTEWLDLVERRRTHVTAGGTVGFDAIGVAPDGIAVYVSGS